MLKNTFVEPGRVSEIDGLRGVAILLVITFHYINNQLVLTTNPIGLFLAKATSFGWVGVDLFFVLSGFLIGSILIRSKNKNSYFKQFYIRRLVRILPNYYLFLLIYVLIASISFFQNNYMLRGNNSIPFWSYCVLVHNFFMARFENMGNGALSVTWSIAVEEQFYLFIPVVVYFLKDKLLPGFLILVIVFSIFIRMHYDHWIPAYVLLISRMDAIALGVLVAYFNERFSFRYFSNKNRIVLVLLMMMDICLCAFLYYRFGDLGVIKHTLFGFFFSGCLIFALLKQPYYSGFLRNTFLVGIGRISYSLYLFHYLILIVFHQFIGNENGVVIRNGKDLIITLLALISSFSFAWIIYNWIEQPFVRWGKKTTQY